MIYTDTYIYIYMYIHIYIYISDVIKTIQCAHFPHHHNSFVVTCQLWTARGGVHALSLLYALCFVHIEHSMCHELIYALINIFMLLA